MNPKVLAIRTDFSHHGENSGYKQILKFTNPYKVIGINERDPKHFNRSALLKKYLWLFEFKALTYKSQIDLVHILYGEDYFRWSAHLFGKVPVVATFHQPPEMLEREVLYGDLRGRIGKLTHAFAKNRFSKLSAAIVTSPSQVEVLKKVMPVEKIHHIPLGIYLDQLNNHYTNNVQLLNAEQARSQAQVLTVGVWLRDWEFYFKVVEACPEINFALVNKRFEKEEIERLKNYKNITFHENISDENLYNLFMKSDLQFLPVTGFAGSNAFIQGLALGCPIVLTDVNAEQFKTVGDFIQLYEKGNIESAIAKIRYFLLGSPDNNLVVRKSARMYASEFSWESIAEKTLTLYKTLI